ncbi:hypothetical protein [Sphingobium chlorophenolicum]|uniref:Uncharacterized protein n=1 Tax=Sphingobium chlorophenolicum TaxID=46429 RepID=A0A081RGP6_SPHCR|nr:hypothetical protein [Sphingobium chlorophenolicum]KEQ54369.1 hypothetical protein BV95_01434 [Sphingobium chlorophenolicum]
MKKAIAVVAYDRFDYFSLVLPSILAQTVDGSPAADIYDIFYFQDGFCLDDVRSDASGHKHISAMIGQHAKEGRSYIQQDNLGVALHFDFIEKKLFRDLGYDFVLFCEDDLILAPGYLAAMDLMADRFSGDERIGMFSAHPAHVSASLDEQKSRAHEYGPMDHNWGFGLFGDFWERRQPFVEKYLEIIGKRPYRQRPHRVVYEWLKGCGFRPAASSQDYVKQCSTVALGGVRISTLFNLGMPIGRSGLHCSPEMFDKMGFNNTIVYQGIPRSVGSLEQDDYHRIFKAQSNIMVSPPALIAEGVDKVAVTGWQRRVDSGEFNVERVLGNDWMTHEKPQEAAPKIVWTPQDIPRRPHMEPEGLDKFTERLRNARSYLEYGAGGSTVLAAEMGIERIMSVDSDRGFLKAVKLAACGSEGDNRLTEHFVDIGPTAEWGNPTDQSCSSRWPAYPSTVWRRYLDKQEHPDLVLIKGRFRVACFLTTLIMARSGTTILFDDYFDRPQYHLVEKYLTPVSRAGRMAEFVTNGDALLPAITLDLLERSTDFG